VIVNKKVTSFVHIKARKLARARGAKGLTCLPVTEEIAVKTACGGLQGRNTCAQ